ncbi:hypothetical protein D1007_03030 [Hordeum vulgare]|nr:hypothetical protein D1007_03030 [Hordeum vulgare]
MASGSSSKKSQSNEAWLGSEICDDHIEALRHHRMLPPASLLTVRIPEAETAPTLQEGEIIVFDKHFSRGFGLLASTFFSNYLTFFGLQPHHLALNAILQLASFIVLCEGFLGIEPHLNLWQSLFFLKQQSVKMDKAEVEKLDGPRPITPCGAALVHHRSKSGFPQMRLQESIKQWQKGFFYVKNTSPAHDALNMPPFAIEPPTARKNWQAKYPRPIPEVAQIGAYLDSLKGRGLLGRDLLTTMITCRILPLQRRPHMICQMGNRYDPCLLSTKNFTTNAVARDVNQISTARLDDNGDWEWGLSIFFFEPAADSIAQLFENLQVLNPPAADVVTSDASGIEEEGMIEPHSAASKDSEDALESEGSEPPGEHLKPSIADWTDDDETPPSLSDAAFNEDSNEVEEVTIPPVTRGRRHATETVDLGEAAKKKGKGATASRPAPSVLRQGLQPEDERAALRSVVLVPTGGMCPSLRGKGSFSFPFALFCARIGSSKRYLAGKRRTWRKILHPPPSEPAGQWLMLPRG